MAIQRACARYRTAAKRLMIGALRGVSPRKALGRPELSVLTAFVTKMPSAARLAFWSHRVQIARRAA